MEEQCLRCNHRTETGAICRKELRHLAIVTTCSHVLCKGCAEKSGFTGTQTKTRQCPVCKQPLPNVDDAAEMNLHPTEEYKMSVLCGFDPTTVMECASSALSFWNYQMLQETAYQKHLLLALSKKYGHLDNTVKKIVEEANEQIGGLHKKIGDITEENGRLQQKNVELADTCRERGKKYTELRRGYEVLKKVVQQNQQNSMTEESAEQAMRSFVANPAPEALDDVIRGRPVDTSRVGGISALPPALVNSQHRTPLPGALRIAADRSHSTSAGRNGRPDAFVQPGSGHLHHTARSNSSRQKVGGNYGGITAGMKVGSAGWFPQY